MARPRTTRTRRRATDLAGASSISIRAGRAHLVHERPWPRRDGSVSLQVLDSAITFERHRQARLDSSMTHGSAALKRIKWAVTLARGTLIGASNAANNYAIPWRLRPQEAKTLVRVFGATRLARVNPRSGGVGARDASATLDDLREAVRDEPTRRNGCDGAARRRAPVSSCDRVRCLRSASRAPRPRRNAIRGSVKDDAIDAKNHNIIRLPHKTKPRSTSTAP